MVEIYRTENGFLLQKIIKLDDADVKRFKNLSSQRIVDAAEDVCIEAMLSDNKLVFRRYCRKNHVVNTDDIDEFGKSTDNFIVWFNTAEPECPSHEETLDIAPDKDEIAFVKDLPEPDMLGIEFTIVCKDGFMPGSISPELFTRMINAYLEKYDKDHS